MFADYGISENCCCEESYGAVCIKCGKCGREFDSNGFIINEEANIHLSPDQIKNKSSLKRVVGVSYNNGKVIKVTLDGILDNETDIDDRVVFRRNIYAHWIDVGPLGKLNPGVEFYECSNCKGWTNLKSYTPNYCPNCGAEMIESGDEND